MPCTDCYNDCGTSLTSDQCVKYTGGDIPALGLCTNDPLLTFENVVTSQLTALSAGQGISVTGITGCNSVVALFDSVNSLSSILQSFSTNICASISNIVSLQSALVSSYSFDIACLTGLTSTSTRDQIIQASIYQVCTNTTAVTAIQSDYVKASQLNTLIQQYIQSTTSSSSSTTIIQQSTLFSPYIAYEYYGPLTNFDSTGKGLVSTGYDKVYVCNGQNGTPDKRGRVTVGAIAGVPGGSLDAAVDPSLPANAGRNYALNDKFGSSSITLLVSNLPSHTHGITDPGHKHTFNPDGGRQEVARSGSGTALRFENYAVSATTTTNTTGISIGSTGANSPHDNVQPSIAANYIMFIPS